MLLSKMKKMAEDFLGESVTDAVITVPAYYNSKQKQCVMDSALIAKINVLRFIQKPRL